jgi:dynein heavy chain
LQVKQLGIPASDTFDFCGFLADPATVQDWNMQGLPADAFSTANGVMVARGKRWPLLIDPQVGVMSVAVDSGSGGSRCPLH